MERQQNTNRIMTLMFAQAAHEFRNPLNAIISSLDLLEDRLVDKQDGDGGGGEGDYYFTVAKNCANLMLFLMNDIMDFAQVEQRKLLLNLEQFKLEPFLQQCINVLKF